MNQVMKVKLVTEVSLINGSNDSDSCDDNDTAANLKDKTERYKNK